MTDGIFEAKPDEDYTVTMWLSEVHRIDKEYVWLVGIPRAGRYQGGNLPIKARVAIDALPKGNKWLRRHANGHLQADDITIIVECKNGKFSATVREQS
jgi:hypothetical protein